MEGFSIILSWVREGRAAKAHRGESSKMQSKEGKSQGGITGEKGKLVGKWRTERLRKWKGKG